jgi:HEAT repeat protein
LRERLAELLRRGRFDEFLAEAQRDRRAVRSLTGLLYHDEELVRWRAVSMFGRLAADMPGAVGPIIKRLLWFMSEESSTVGWGSAQAIAEMYRCNPAVAKDAIRVVVHYLDDEELSEPANRNTYMLAGSIWGIGRIAGVDHPLAMEMAPELVRFLGDPDAQVRTLSAWSLGKLGYEGAEQALQRLLGDRTEAELYEDGELRAVSVGQAASESLDRIKVANP